MIQPKLLRREWSLSMAERRLLLAQDPARFG